MRIVVAPDSFKESLSAEQAARAIARGLQRSLSNPDIIMMPMADGGEGTTRTFVSATGGRLIEARVSDPLGQPLTAVYGVDAQETIAVVEIAEASGLERLPLAERNPMRTTTAGTGELIAAALSCSPRTLIVGLGGSATVDGGAGILQALGVRLLDRFGEPLAHGGGALSELQAADFSAVDPRLRQVELLVACDVDNVLTGEHGAAHVFGPQKGADPAMVAVLDANLQRFARVVETATGLQLASVPGAGAAGGAAAGLLSLGAKLVPGVELIARSIGLETAIEACDLVITGEGRLDGQTTHGKVPAGVAALARRHRKPVIALAGSVAATPAQLQSCGLDAAFSICPSPMPLSEALRNAEAHLEHTASQIGGLLSAVTAS